MAAYSAKFAFISFAAIAVSIQVISEVFLKKETSFKSNRRLDSLLSLSPTIFSQIYPLIFSDQEELYKCPEPGADPVVVPGGRPVQFEVASSDTLCTLVSKTYKYQSFFNTTVTDWMIPVGRSYKAKDWEAYSGDYSEQNFFCEGSICETTIEKQELEFKLFPLSSAFIIAPTYELRSYSEERDLTDMHISARFLEQATFGATMSEISALASSDDKTFANWIHDQMYSVPYTSHRKRFRDQANIPTNETKNYGSPQHPCENNTMWRSYTFQYVDTSEDITVRISAYNQTIDGDNETFYLMSTNDMLRTEISEFEFLDVDVDVDGNLTFEFPVDLQICKLEEQIGGMLKFNVNGTCYFLKGGNPPIYFNVSQTPYPELIIEKEPGDFAEFITPPGNEVSDTYYLEGGLNDEICSYLHVGAYPVYIYFGPDSDPQWLSFGPRLKLLENTISEPLFDGGGSQEILGSRCSNVVRNYLNADSCKLSNDLEACSSAYEFPDAEIQLTSDTLLTFLELTDNYVYALNDLRVETSPCALDAMSRWQLIENNITNVTFYNYNNVTVLENVTLTYFNGTVINITDGSECDITYVEDYNFTEFTECDFTNAIEFNVTQLKEIQYTEVEDYNVTIFECTDNTTITDPDTLATLSLLLQSAEEDQSIFSPESGWLRDIEYTDGTCSIPLTTPNLNVSTTRSYVMVQIENECWELVHPDYFNVYDMTPWVSRHPGGSERITQFGDNNLIFLDFPWHHEMDRWDMNKRLFPFLGRYNGTVLFQDIPSALQQRNVAELFGAASGTEADGLIVVCGSPDEVPNDITKGISGFSMLFDDGTDHQDNEEFTKQRFAIWTDVVLSSPDQLRQRMAWALSQLFAVNPEDVSLGDQTESLTYFYDIFVRNAFGKYFDVLKEISYSVHMAEMLTFINSKSPAYVYDSSRVIVYADENYAREIMQLFSIGTKLLNMDGTPIRDPVTGDEIESYTNEQIQSFARAWTGFTYSPVRGNIELAEDKPNTIDPMSIIADWRDIFPKVDLYEGHIGDGYPLCEDMPPQSFLRKGAVYRLLGSKTALELSTNPPSTINITNHKVTLSTDSELYKELCRPETTGGTDCNFIGQVTLSENLGCNGQECLVDTVRQVEVAPDIFFEYVRQPCVELSYFSNPKTITQKRKSSSMCANPDTAIAGEACCSSGSSTQAEERNCEYMNERVTYDTANERCSAIGQSICAFTQLSCSSVCCEYNDYFFWHEDPCTLKLKVEPDTGEIAIVHSPGDHSVHSYFDEDTLNYFEVYWTDGEYPTPSNNCGDGECSQLDGSCICDVNVENTPVFSTAPSAGDLSQLFIGSVSPDTFDDGVYDAPIQEGNIKVYFKSGNSYDINTIFEVQDENELKYLKNMKSSVKVGTYSLRNPPHFMNFIESDARDAHYETDAVLQQYLKHPNVPPFVSKYFLLRFGMSNPSPRYVENVANAFKKGLYEYEETSFGSGEFGDLKAMLAAILLDDEARTVLLDQDPVHGGLREPLLKVIAMMRSLEYNPFTDYLGTNTLLNSMTSKIDQMVYQLKTVFSFFFSDYSPGGIVQQATLVAPEGLRYLAPYVVGLMNGITSMVKYGLSDCDQGFGAKVEGLVCEAGNWSSGQGNFTFIPTDPSNAEVVVDELATLLTAGRLNEQSREIIREEFLNAEDDQEGYLIAQQLVLSTPEFHTTSLTKFSGEPRPDIPPIEPSNKEFKALIYFELFGGLDSYNVLVPHSVCEGKNYYDDYKEIRGDIALDNATLLMINTGGERQPCEYFGIHYDLPVLHELYNDGDLLFFANVGYLFEDVTNVDWRQKTKSPVFSHFDGEKNAQTLDPYNVYDGTGVLGRMADVLTARGYKTGSFSVSSNNYALIGEPAQSPSVYYVDSNGVKQVFPNPIIPDLKEKVYDVNNATTEQSGMFGETWSSTLQDSIVQSEILQEALENATLFNASLFEGGLGSAFKVISKIIKQKDVLGLDRAVFFMKTYGFDTHTNQEERLGERFETISSAIDAFAQEMKGQNMWSNVALMTQSDFGRTISPNGGEGTDHGWAGHYFALGGSLRGGRILGEYPDLDGPYSIGRGRMIPSTSWDAIFNGLAQWFGVTNEDDLNKVLPNRGSFSRMFQENDLF